MDGQEPADTGIHDEDKVLGESVQSDGKGTFRYQAKQVFLTYSQADGLLRSDLISALQELGYHKIFGGEEQHRDGGRHYHILAEYSGEKKRFETRNCRFWDVKEHHPNVRHVKNWDRCFAYCAKGGNIFTIGDVDPVLAGGSIKGFSGRKRDCEELIRHVKAKFIRSPFPIALPYEKQNEPFFSIAEPRYWHRQRCLYVFGKAGTGKSTYFEEKLAGRSHYVAGDGDLSFDTYSGELCVLYDDRLPTLLQLISVLNYSTERRPCPGRQRYVQRFFEANQARFVIIIYNRRVAWDMFCTCSAACTCPGCSRTIYFDWDKHYDFSMIKSLNKRIDFC